MPKKGCCRECKYADWDADGCTCMIDGRLVYNASDYACDQYRPAKPLTNADRIRQMVDEELSAFLGWIADNCSYNTCDNCPMYGACVDVPLSRDKWLKQEVSEDAGTD